MIEAIVAAALAKIAEGTGGALVDLIRRQLGKRKASAKSLEILSRVAAGDVSEADKREFQALLVMFASQDRDFLSRLQDASTSVGAINSVTSSDVQKLIQAQNVGDVTM